MIERDDLRDGGRQPPPGQGVIIGLGLALGVLLMTLQLWLLTLAFDLYLGGQRSETVVAAIISGLVFLGGLAMLRVLDRRPRRRH
jgi:hypothetical protein